MRPASKILPVFAVTLTLLLGFAGCRRSNSTNVDGKILRLDRAVASIAAGDSIDPAIAKPLSIYMQILGADAANPLKQSVDSFAATQAFQIFGTDVEARSDIFNDVEVALSKLNTNITSSIDTIPALQFFGIVSPYRQQIVIDSARVFIVLNHYLGEDYPGYAGLPEYARQLKSPDRILPDVAESILASHYPYVADIDGTTLNRLLYEGALTYAIASLTRMPVDQLLGWDNEQAKMVIDSESHIWAELIKRELLYSADPAVASRLVDPSPATSIISLSLPGRVGRYIGYRIVDTYLQSNPLTLQQLLSPSFYNDPLTLVKAGYHG